DCRSRWSSGRSSKCIKTSCSVSRDTGITLDSDANLPWPAMAGAFSSPTWSGPNHRLAMGFFGHLAFFGQPPKCDVAHTSLPIRPSKLRHGDIYLARQEGTNGTKTRTS